MDKAESLFEKIAKELSNTQKKSLKIDLMAGLGTDIAKGGILLGGGLSLMKSGLTYRTVPAALRYAIKSGAKGGLVGLLAGLGTGHLTYNTIKDDPQALESVYKHRKKSKNSLVL